MVSSPAPPPLDLLPPMPVERDDESWSYRRTDSGHRFAVSCTQLLGSSKSPAAMAAIEASRHIWEPRGNAAHAALEAWLLGHQPDCSDYGQWIEPLLSHRCWDAVTIIGIECRLFDQEQDVAGTADVLVRYRDGTVGAWDLKTKQTKKSSRQDVRPQLGFATRVLCDWYGLQPSRNAVLWSYPGECVVESFEADECHMAWQDAHESYLWSSRPW